MRQGYEKLYAQDNTNTPKGKAKKERREQPPLDKQLEAVLSEIRETRRTVVCNNNAIRQTQDALIELKTDQRITHAKAIKEERRARCFWLVWSFGLGVLVGSGL